MRPGRLRFDLELILGVALLSSLGMILYLSWRLGAVERQRAGVERALRQPRGGCPAAGAATNPGGG